MKNIDFLGGNINFNIDKTPRLTSTFGGIFTIISGIFLVLLFVGFGRNFYKRINPIVVRSPEIPKDYTFINVTNTDLSFSFRFEDFDGNAVYNDQIFFIEGTYIDQVVDKNGEWKVLDDSSVNNVPCEKEMFPEDTNIRLNMDTTQFRCPIFGGKDFGGFWDGNKISYFYFSIKYCSEGFHNPEGKPCLSDEEKDKLLDNMVYISIYYQKLIIDPTLYETPMKKEIENIYYILDKKATKDIFIYFNSVKIVSDYGWLLEEKQSISEVGIKRYTTDVYNIAKNDPKDGNFQLAAITLHYSKDIELYNREYMKIQTLAANIGGIIKIIMVIGAGVTYMYNEYKAILEFEFITKIYDNDLKHDYLQKSLQEQKKKILRQQTMALNKINLKQVKNLNEYNGSGKVVQKEKKEKSKSIIPVKNDKILVDYENYNSKEILNSYGSNEKHLDSFKEEKVKIKKYSMSPSKKYKNLKEIKDPNHKVSKTNLKPVFKDNFEKDVLIIESIKQEVESKKANHYDSIGFYEVLKFMCFSITCNGICCYSTQLKKHYSDTYNNFARILELDEFIKDKIQLKRLTEVVLTENQMKLIRM